MVANSYQWQRYVLLVYIYVIVFKAISGAKELRCGGLDWIELAQTRDRWRALVNAVMKLWVYKMRRISWLAENRLASQEGLCCMEWVSKYVSKFLHTTSITDRELWYSPPFKDDGFNPGSKWCVLQWSTAADRDSAAATVRDWQNVVTTRGCHRLF
jgi:hypothetical protein